MKKHTKRQFSLLLYVKLFFSKYCNAKNVGILGIKGFKQILNIFTLEHEKAGKTAVLIAFIRKTVHFYLLQYLGVFKQILSIFTLEYEKTCKTAVFIPFIRNTVNLYVLQCK